MAGAPVSGAAEKRSCAKSPPDLRGLGPGVEGLEPYYDLVIVGAGLSGG